MWPNIAPAVNGAHNKVWSFVPSDLVRQILARVPRHRLPVLSCVSKEFQKICCSPEMAVLRRRIRGDSVMLMFTDTSNANLSSYWYRLTRHMVNPSATPRFRGTEMPNFPAPVRSFHTILHRVFVVCGSGIIPASLWLYDSETRQLHAAPSMGLELLYKASGLICNKLYILGIGKESQVLQAEFFDITVGVWRSAPLVLPENFVDLGAKTTACVDEKIYCLNPNVVRPLYYNPGDGSCSFFDMFHKDWSIYGTTVIDNVLFAFYTGSGLMWFDPTLNKWDLVTGLVFNVSESVVLAEFNGGVAFFMIKKGTDNLPNKLFFTLISLTRTIEGGFHGVPQRTSFLATMPGSFGIRQCFTISG